MKKMLLLMVIALLLTLPAEAIDAKKFEKDLYDYAAINAYLDVVMHPGVPHSGTVNSNLPEMMGELDRVKRSIQTTVNTIQTLQELAEAQIVVEAFKNMHGFEKEVGVFVDQMLQERAKFLKVHSS